MGTGAWTLFHCPPPSLPSPWLCFPTKNKAKQKVKQTKHPLCSSPWAGQVLELSVFWRHFVFIGKALLNGSPVCTALARYRLEGRYRLAASREVNWQPGVGVSRLEREPAHGSKKQPSSLTVGGYSGGLSRHLKGKIRESGQEVL